MPFYTGQSTSPRGEKWQRNPYFCNITMSSAAIEEYLDTIGYDGGEITYLEKRAGQPGHAGLSGGRAQLRARFQPDFDQSGADIVVFFVQDEGYHMDEGDSPRICISRADFDWLMETVHVHPAFVDVFQNKWVGAYVTLQTQTPSQSAFHIAVRLPSSGCVEGSFYIRLELKPRKRFIAIFFGNDIDEQEKIIQEYDFRNLENDCGFPVLLPLLKRYKDFIWSENRADSENIKELELLTGRGARGVYQIEELKVDEETVKYLHHWTGNLRIECHAWEFQLELTRFLREAFLELVGFARSDNRLLQTDAQSNIHKAFTMHQNFVYRRLKNKTEVQMGRAMAQISAVDQLLNQKANDASVRIASESQKDNSIMKVISLLGIIYLPTSLIAGICSTVFINQPANPGPIKVDPAIWKFALTCVLLTIATLAAASWKMDFYKDTRAWIRGKAVSIRFGSENGTDDVEKMT